MMNEWKYTESIRSAAEQYISESNLTHAQFAGRIAGNFSVTRVTKYLNLNGADNKPEQDAPKVEAAIRSFLRHVSRGLKLQSSLYENSVSRDLAAVMRQIRRTGDVGLIHGDGGEGKTCGAILFCRSNPDSLYVVAKHPYACSDWSLMEMVFREFSAGISNTWNGNGSKWDWLERELRGTERLLIIDDAELLYLSAFRWAFSMHDATGLSICFIGNSEVITKIAQADQSGKMVSRIGIVHNAQMKDDAPACATLLVEQFAPGAGADLVDIVTRTITQFGHSRRARKQLTLAAEILRGGSEKDWLKCYAKAGEKLITGRNQKR